MTPENLQRKSQPIVNVFLRIEDEILMNMAKKLKRDRSLLTQEGYLSWQLLKLQDLNELTNMNLRTIAKYSGVAFDEVVNLLEKEGYSASESIDRQLAEAVKKGRVLVPPSGQSNAMQNILSAYQARAGNTLNMANVNMINSARTAYISIINETVGLTLTGVKTPQQALLETAARWSGKGMPALVDKAGKRWTPEAYINMVIRTNITNVTNDMQQQRMDEYGIDLVEISSHLGARPKCAPYQGKIYSVSGNSIKYPPFNETSYGELDGLLGINCRHVKYPFVEGISIHRESNIDDTENDRVYKESQKQRFLEREIRKSRREINMMKELESEEGLLLANQKMKAIQNSMSQFIENTGRTRRRNREQLPN